MHIVCEGSFALRRASLKTNTSGESISGLYQSISAVQFDEPRLFFAPKLRFLYRRPRCQLESGLSTRVMQS